MGRPKTTDPPEMQKVIYRPMPEKRTFEHAVRELFPEPPILELELTDGRLLEFRSHVLAYALHWENNPHILVDAAHAQAAAVHLFGEMQYWGGWLAGADLPDTVGNYRYEGLNALSSLFRKTLNKHLKPRMARSIKGYSAEEYPDTEPTARVCRFDSWFQGFALALQDFLVDEPESLSPTLEAAIIDYVRDLDFVERSSVVRKQKQTRTLPILRDFALWWDVFPIPLRFFTDEAAHGFCQDRLGYKNRSLQDYRRIFRNGGSESKGAGLEGLTPRAPAVIKEWSETLENQPIAIKSAAAMVHGLDPHRSAIEIEGKTARFVVVSKRR